MIILVYLSYLKMSEKTHMAELLSIQEVAQITGLHEITIRRYVRSGELEAVRIGRRIRVQREAVDRLMKPMHPDPEPALESEPYLKEGAAAYEVTSQRQAVETIPEVVGRIALQLVQLPADDVSAVAQLVARLRQQRQPVLHHLTVEMPADSLLGLMDLLPPIGGDALADTDALYDQM
jgi:excisionase family DNA binding protein